MSEMKVVDGGLMVTTLSALKYDIPVSEIDPETLDAEKLRRMMIGERYRRAGFRAKADKITTEVSALSKQYRRLKYEQELQRWRDRGYFVINFPTWDGQLKPDDTGLNFFVPYKVVSTKRRMSVFRDYQALFAVSIANWVGDVPTQVLETVEQFADDFNFVNGLQIMFVARRSALTELVSNFVQHDPVLCGRLQNHLVVLKMWGSDLSDISLALLDPTLEGNK